MKRIIISFFIVALACSCSQKYPTSLQKRTVKVSISNALSGYNAAGDKAYDYCSSRYVGYATEAGDRQAAMSVCETPGVMTINATVREEAQRMWCYTSGAIGMKQTFSLAAVRSRTVNVLDEDLKDMLYCSQAIDITSKSEVSCEIQPLTTGVVLNIYDSSNSFNGYEINSYGMISNDAPLAADVTISLEGAQIEYLTDESVSAMVKIDNTDGNQMLSVGTKAAPATVGMVVLPCAFEGEILVSGPKFTASIPVNSALYLQAGYVKTIAVDLAVAKVKHFPRRLGILGDSISTYEGKIPSGYSKYYPTTNSACADVDSWTKTYWGHLINDYWHCELDVNSSWSGGCVAPGSTRTATPMTIRCRDFVNPDVIIFFGGTNDCSTSTGVDLGEYDYTTPVGNLDTDAKFRQSYIAVIRTIQAAYPKAQIICIIGNHINRSFDTSIEEIAAHYGLPVVDFRGDYNVTIYDQLHPNAAGHAYMAKKIYEQTLDLFK